MDIQYTRDDVDFETWYSSWMKQLAKLFTVEELESKLYGAKKEANKSSRSHLRAIERTHSMGSNSQARAHARNVTAAAGDYAIALRGAIEIHKLFPEYAKRPTKPAPDAWESAPLKHLSTLEVDSDLGKVPTPTKRR